MIRLQRVLNNLFILVLCLVLMAGDAYEFIKHEIPCPLCLLQRLGMIGACIALLLNLRFGIKVQHYGLAILSALIGRLVSLRQICLHICPEFPIYGDPIFGFELYFWAFIVFTCTILSCAILLIIHGYTKAESYPPTWGFFEKIVFSLVLILTVGNIITTFMNCGLSSC